MWDRQSLFGPYCGRTGICSVPIYETEAPRASTLGNDCRNSIKEWKRNDIWILSVVMSEFSAAKVGGVNTKWATASPLKAAHADGLRYFNTQWVHAWRNSCLVTARAVHLGLCGIEPHYVTPVKTEEFFLLFTLNKGNFRWTDTRRLFTTGGCQGQSSMRAKCRWRQAAAARGAGTPDATSRELWTLLLREAPVNIRLENTLDREQIKKREQNSRALSR